MPDPAASLNADPRTGAADHQPGVAKRSRRRVVRARQTVWRRQFFDFDPRPVDVSVCIANWNCRDLLRGCLKSLHDQPQGVRLETIVVDNASTDGAAEMVRGEFPEVVLLRNATNLGFARANNQAARCARGRYLFFLNNDTVVPRGTLRTLLNYSDISPGVGMIGPCLRDGHGKPQASYRLRPTLATFLHRTTLLRWTRIWRGRYRQYRRENFDCQNTRQVEVLMGAAVWLPKAVFFACGGWDESFTFGGEDLDLSDRVGRHYPIMYHPAAEIIHYGRASTRQHIVYASCQIPLGFLRYLRKSGYRRRTLLGYKLIVTLDAPVQLLEKSVQFLWRRARGDERKAQKTLVVIRGLTHFLCRGLIAFWKA